MMKQLKDLMEEYGDYEVDEKELKEFLFNLNYNLMNSYFKPEETFYYIDGTTIDVDVWDNKDEYQLLLLKQGNCFKTYEEADWEYNRRIVEAKLLRCGSRNVGKYYLCLAYFDPCVTIEKVKPNTMLPANAIYFKDRESFNAAFKDIGEEKILKYMFGESGGIIK